MRLAHVSWVKAEQYFKNNDMIIIATGSNECHGKHIALGTDTLIPNKILDLIEEKSDVMIAPILPYGACDDLSKFPGTITLGTDVLYSVLKKITDGFFGFGVRRFVFLNGHGGNINVLDRICSELHQRGALAVELNWWLMAWELNPAWKGGHGGAEETAAVMAVNENFVDKDMIGPMELKNDIGENMVTTGFRSVKYKGVTVQFPRFVKEYAGNGWIGPDHPEKATPEWGREMLQATADYIVDFMQEMKKLKLPEPMV